MHPLEALRPRWVVSAPKLIFMPLKLAENPFFRPFSAKSPYFREFSDDLAEIRTQPSPNDSLGTLKISDLYLFYFRFYSFRPNPRF